MGFHAEFSVGRGGGNKGNVANKVNDGKTTPASKTRRCAGAPLTIARGPRTSAAGNDGRDPRRYRSVFARFARRSFFRGAVGLCRLGLARPGVVELCLGLAQVAFVRIGLAVAGADRPRNAHAEIRHLFAGAGSVGGAALPIGKP